MSKTMKEIIENDYIISSKLRGELENKWFSEEEVRELVLLSMTKCMVHD